MLNHFILHGTEATVYIQQRNVVYLISLLWNLFDLKSNFY